MNKVLRIGSILPYKSAAVRSNVFCKVEVTDGKLSISGVIGPKRNGDAVGGCGQIDMEFAHRNPSDNDRRYSEPVQPSEIDFAPGWTADQWLDFLDIWKKWHMNDTCPECEHQRALGWRELASKEVTLYRWRLTDSTSKMQRLLKDSSLDALKDGQTVAFTPDQQTLIALDYSLTTHTEQLPEQLAPFYEPKRPLYPGDGGVTEKKTLGWLYPKDHPDGILTKPCPECGYKYGSAWKSFPLPDDVVSFLEKLPVTDVTPAWV